MQTQLAEHSIVEADFNLLLTSLENDEQCKKFLWHNLDSFSINQNAALAPPPQVAGVAPPRGGSRRIIGQLAVVAQGGSNHDGVIIPTQPEQCGQHIIDQLVTKAPQRSTQQLNLLAQYEFALVKELVPNIKVGNNQARFTAIMKVILEKKYNKNSLISALRIKIFAVLESGQFDGDVLARDIRTDAEKDPSAIQRALIDCIVDTNLAFSQQLPVCTPIQLKHSCSASRQTVLRLLGIMPTPNGSHSTAQAAAPDILVEYIGSFLETKVSQAQFNQLLQIILSEASNSNNHSSCNNAQVMAAMCENIKKISSDTSGNTTHLIDGMQIIAYRQQYQSSNYIYDLGLSGQARTNRANKQRNVARFSRSCRAPLSRFTYTYRQVH